MAKLIDFGEKFGVVSFPDDTPDDQIVAEYDALRTRDLTPGDYAKQIGGSLIRGVTETAASIPEGASRFLEATGNIIPRTLSQLTPIGQAAQAAGIDIGEPLKALGRGEAQLISQAGEAIAPAEVPELKESFWATAVPRGIGSSAAFLAGGAAGAAAKIPGWLTIGGLGALSSGSDFYKEAKASGADESTANLASLFGNVVGTSEALGIGGIVDRLNKLTGNSFTKALVAAGKETLEEAFQEAGQQFAQNWTAKQLYDEDRDLYDQIATNAGVGGTTGLLMSTLASALGIPIARSRMRRGVERRQAGIRQAVEEGQVFEQPLGETYAQEIRAPIETPGGPETPRMVGGEEGRLRVRDVTEDRLEAVQPAPETTPPIVAPPLPGAVAYAAPLRATEVAPSIFERRDEAGQLIGGPNRFLISRNTTAGQSRETTTDPLAESFGAVRQGGVEGLWRVTVLQNEEPLTHESFNNEEQARRYAESRSQIRPQIRPEGTAQAPPRTRIPIQIRQPDGTTVPGEFTGYYDLTSMGRGMVPSVGYVQPDGTVTHGMLKPGETIATPVPTPEQWQSGQAAAPVVGTSRRLISADQVYGTERVPTEVNELLKSENVTARDILTTIGTVSPEFGAMASHLLAIADPVGLSAKVRSATDTARSYYRVGENLIVMANRGANIHTGEFIHEILHALTMAKISPLIRSPGRLMEGPIFRASLDAVVADPNVSGTLKNVVQLYQYALEAYAGPDISDVLGNPNKVFQRGGWYGLGDLNEFISEAFSNREFQKWLDSIPGPERTKSLWASVVDAIRQILGLPASDTSLLQAILEAGAELAAAERGTVGTWGGTAFAPPVGAEPTQPTFFKSRQQVQAVLNDPSLTPAARQFATQLAQVQSSMTSDKMMGFLMATPKDDAERVAQRLLDYLQDRRYMADTVRWFNSLPATTEEERQAREVAASVVLGHYGTDRMVEKKILTNLEELQNAMQRSMKNLAKMNTQQLKANFLTASFNHLTTEFKRYLANRNATSPAGENLQAQWRQQLSAAQERLNVYEQSPTAIKKALSALAVTLPDNLIKNGTNQEIVDWTIQNGALFGEVSDAVQDWLLRDDGTGSPALLGYTSLRNDLEGLRDVLNHQQAIRRELEAFEQYFQPSGTARLITPKQFAQRYFRFRSQRDRAMRIARTLEREVEDVDNKARGNVIALERLQEMMRSPEYVNTVTEAANAAHVVVKAIYDVENRGFRGLVERGGKGAVPPGLWKLTIPDSQHQYIVDLSPSSAKEQANQGTLKSFALEARTYANKYQNINPLVADSYRDLADYIDKFLVHPSFDPAYGFTERPWVQIPGTTIRVSLDPFGWSPKTIKDTLEKIGGRPVRQSVTDMVQLDTTMKRVEGLNQHPKYGYAAQAQAILKALASHNWSPDRFGAWDEQIAEPIIASAQNRLSSTYEVGDVVVGSGGVRITAEDMAAIRIMKEWSDAVISVAPEHIRDTYGDLGVIRKAIGGGRFTMARVVAPWVEPFLKDWKQATTPQEKIKVLDDPESETFRRVVMGYLGEFNPELNKMNPGSPDVSPLYQLYRSLATREKLGIEQFTNWNQVMDFLADEMVSRNLAPDTATARKMAEDGLLSEISKMIESFETEVINPEPDVTLGSVPAPVIKVATANNSFTMRRGNLVAPSTFYNYSVGSYPRRATHVGQLRSFLNLKVLQSMYETQDALASAKADMDKRIDKLVKSGMKRASAFGQVVKETRQARRASEIRYDYLEVESALSMVERLIKEMERFETSTTEHYGHPGTEAWMNIFASLKSFLLSSPQSIVTNTFGGLMLGPAMVHMQTGRYSRALTDFVAQPHIWATLYRRLASMVAGNPIMSKLLRQHAPLWSTISKTVIDAAADWRRVQETAEKSGMVSPYNLNDVLETKAALKTTAGRLEQESPNGLVRLVNSVMSAPLARVGIEVPRALTPRIFDNFINYALIIGFEYQTDFLKKMGWAAYKSREQRAAQTGADYRDLSKPENILTPGDLGLRSFKALDRYRQIFAGLGSLDHVLLDFYERTKHLSKEERRKAPLILDENDHLATAIQYAAITNIATETNRSQLFKGKGSEGLLRNIAGTFMGWTVNLLRQLSKILETHSSDPNFNSYAQNAIGLAMMVVLFSLTGMWNWELGDELTRLLYGKHPARIKAGNVQDWQTAMLYFIQGLVNTVPVMGPALGGVAGLPYTGRGNPFDLTSINPILGWIYDTWNTGKRIAQTGDATLPLADYTRRWVPFSNILINRLPVMQGLLDHQNAVRSMNGAAPPGTDILWGSRPGGESRYGPANDEIQKLIASAYEAVAHGGSSEAVYQRYREAIDAYIRTGRTPEDAQRAVASALAGKEPIRILTGRELTREEEDRWLKRMNPLQREDYNRATDAFRLLSSVTGRDLNMVAEPGGGAGGLGIAGLVSPLRGAGLAGIPSPYAGAGLAAAGPVRTRFTSAIRPIRIRRARLGGRLRTISPTRIRRGPTVRVTRRRPGRRTTIARTRTIPQTRYTTVTTAPPRRLRRPRR